MKQMFLPGSKHSPQPGPYRALIEQMQAQGAEYPQIGKNPRSPTFPAPPTTWPDSRRRSLADPRRSALGPGELIAAYPSMRNQCAFLTESPRRSCGGAVGDAALVASVMADLETSAFDEKHKALFRFVDKVNHGRRPCRPTI